MATPQPTPAEENSWIGMPRGAYLPYLIYLRSCRGHRRGSARRCRRRAHRCPLPRGNTNNRAVQTGKWRKQGNSRGERLKNRYLATKPRGEQRFGTAVRRSGSAHCLRPTTPPSRQRRFRPTKKGQGCCPVPNTVPLCRRAAVRHVLYGWGGRIRTSECRIQSPVPYRLATPQRNADVANIILAYVGVGGNHLGVCLQHCTFDHIPQFLVGWMRHIAKTPIETALAGHRHK